MKKLLKHSLFLMVWVMAISQVTYGQVPVFQNSHYLFHAVTTPLSNASVTAAQVTGTTAPGSPLTMSYSSVTSLPAPLAIPTRKVNKAVFSVKANTGDDYEYGVETSNLFFKYKISFQLDAVDNSGNVVSTPQIFDKPVYEITLENKKPEAAWLLDFTAFANIANPGMNSDFLFKKFQISNVVLTPLIVADPANPTYASLLAQIANSIRFELDYDIEYGLDVTSVVAKPSITSISYPTVVTKRQVFNWSNGGYEYPNYEFQLLRLFNIDPTKISDEQAITTNIDWSKALRLETQSSATTMTLNIAEGTGYYVWRVRPIGTYYPGGIANHLNYDDGSWSEDLPSLTNVVLGFNTSNNTFSGYNGALANPFFFFSDPDDPINWIYSRKFTEGNKMSESITYATPGQHIRQVQSYLASKDTTLVVQTVVDQTGRPSLNTIPVPTSGSIQKYKPRFVTKDGTTTLYQDTDFDTDVNYRNPTKVDQSIASDFKYYSENNPDKNIPDAQGYPYQRTLYYNDGSGRVMEQSGVGKTHMIGDGTTGGDGKTVKTLYGTASESELIRLFGDEAPDHEGVMKTITIDQNGTASVSYASKEGKVIATALSYQINDNLETFDKLDGEQSATDAQTTEQDKITRNIKTDWGFMSTKRVAFTYPTTLDLNYKVKCQVLEQNCFNVGLDCQYKVQIIVHCVEDPTKSFTLAQQDLPIASCSGGYISTSWPVCSLTAGTYIIEKRLTTGDPQVVIEDAQAKAEKQIMPLINMVTGKLKAVNCEKELEDFYCWLDELTNDIYNAYPSRSGTSPVVPTCDPSYVATSGASAAEMRYGFTAGFLQPEHVLTIIRTPDGSPTSLRVQSPCCDLTVSVRWVPPFRCPSTFGVVQKDPNVPPRANLNFLTDPSATEFFPDFEGYIMAILKDCIIGNSPILQALSPNDPNFNQTFKDVFYGNAIYDGSMGGLRYTFMSGWNKEGDFNYMVLNMLTDSYDCRNQFEVSNGIVSNNNGNPAAPGQSVPELDDCGNPLSANSTISCDGNGACTQYQCSQLSNCITALAAKMSNLMCDQSFTVDSPIRPSDKADEQSTSDPKTKTHDDQFNNNFDGAKLSKRKKKKLAKKISEMMRDLQNIADPAFIYEGHLVSEFLDCSGYKFAKILTPLDPSPDQALLPNDINPNLVNNTTNPALNYAVPYVTTNTFINPLQYSPNGDWPNGVTHYTADANSGNMLPDKYLSDLFPKIKDPHFAFKYFEYEEDQRSIELLTCYTDPNDCKDASGKKVPCCFEPTTTPNVYTYELCDIRNDLGHRNFDGDNDGFYSISNPLDQNYVVKNFCGRGQVTCPYTHEVWSCGQRNTFYDMIKNLKQPEGPQTVTKNLDNTETCDLYTNPNPGTDPDLAWTPNEIGSWADYKRPSDNADITTISVVTYEMRQMEFQCTSKCSERRGEFRDALVKILLDRCYQIGGCKSDANDNVILESDIDAIIDQVVAKCKTQCPINTYDCLGPVRCRDANAPITLLGATQVDVEILYGIDASGNDCELKKWKEVMQWAFEIDIPSMCPTNPGYTSFSCTDNPDLCTTPDTAVDGVLDSNAPVDPANIQATTPAVSPGIGVQVSLPEGY